MIALLLLLLATPTNDRHSATLGVVPGDLGVTGALQLNPTGGLARTEIAATDANSLLIGGSGGLVTIPSAASLTGSVTLSGVVQFTAALRLPRPSGSNATSPAEPLACAAGTTGYIVYADDTDDGAAAALCTCLAVTDSTYDWRRVDDNSSACPFF